MYKRQLLHGAHQADEAEISAHLQVYLQRLHSYPRWPELDELLYKLPVPVPEDARPEDDDAAPAPPRALAPPSTDSTVPGGRRAA